jgi:hypothetical protein
MRGAVLHGLGLNLITERTMRRSYGIVTQPDFVSGVHNERRKIMSPIDGSIRCRDVMRWFATKVSTTKMRSVLSIEREDRKWHDSQT